MIEVEKEQLNIPQTESLEITKNTKGYNWRVRIFPKNEDDKAWIKRLSELNEALKAEYGGSPE